MGTEGAKAVVVKFAGEKAFSFHPMVGVRPVGALDVLVDHYKSCFYHNFVSNERYVFSSLVHQLYHVTQGDTYTP